FNITFNPNGTFGGAFNGHWFEQDGTLLLGFDSGPAKYGINVASNVGTGAISTLAGLNGAAYLTKAGTVGFAEPAAAAHCAQKQSHNAAGNPSCPRSQTIGRTGPVRRIRRLLASVAAVFPVAPRVRYASARPAFRRPASMSLAIARTTNVIANRI